MSFLLKVPYFGQVGTGSDAFSNDCGATCVKMVLEYAGISTPNVDYLFAEINPKNDKYLSINDLLHLLGSRNLQTAYKEGVSNKDLWEILSNGTAPIALIRYGALASIRPNRFTGSHYVVVVGMDLDTVYIHDPLNTPTTGKNIAVPLALWDSCFSTVGDNNPQRALIIQSGNSSKSKIIRYVTPKDTNGINVRSIVGDTSNKTRLYAIPYGQRIPIYLEKDDWGKISSTSEQWVCLSYTVEA